MACGGFENRRAPSMMLCIYGFTLRWIMLGRAFKSGNSWRFASPRPGGGWWSRGCGIERVGNTLVIRSLAVRSLVGA